VPGRPGEAQPQRVVPLRDSQPQPHGCATPQGRPFAVSRGYTPKELNAIIPKLRQLPHLDKVPNAPTDRTASETLNKEFSFAFV